VTVYCLEPAYSSDWVAGAGMTKEHVGLVLTFQLRRAGVKPFAHKLMEIEARLDKLENE
jgi:hypothetical protein